MNEPVATGEVVLPVRQVESSIEAGFRVQWIEASSEDLTAELCSGAGFGSPYMVLTVKTQGLDIDEVVDMRDVLPAWIDAAIGRAKVAREGHTLSNIMETTEPTEAVDWGLLVRFEQSCTCGWESGQCYPKETCERAGANHLASALQEIEAAGG